MMTRKQRLLQKFINNPKSLRYSQIELLLIALEFERIEAKGSHKKFKHRQLEQDLIIPVHNNECKPFYKQLVLKTIMKLIP